MKSVVKILEKKELTHDVIQFRTEKPDGIEFTPGQATEIFLKKEGWEEEGRPFTFTSLPADEHLEFVIKTYPSRDGVTAQLPGLNEGDELILNDVFGAIEYKGPGVFIAGGAGITPFISIFRMLRSRDEISDQKLLFANKTHKDIILKDELQSMLGNDFINVLSNEDHPDYPYGLIDEDFIRGNGFHPDKLYYLCGPPTMMDAILTSLKKLGITEEKVVTEEF